MQTRDNLLGRQIIAISPLVCLRRALEEPSPITHAIQAALRQMVARVERQMVIYFSSHHTLFFSRMQALWERCPLYKCKVAAIQPIKNREEQFEETARGKKRSNTSMRITMGRRAYPSDLTDEQWELLASLIPEPSLDGRLPELSRREIVNGILYVLRSGCPWRLLPHDLPVWGTVYWYFRRWRDEGVWDQVLQTLRCEVRIKQGRNAEPSAAIIDSQSIKTSAVRGPEKGYDVGKKNVGPQKTRPR